MLTQILSSVWHRKVLKSLLRGLFFYLLKINGALMQTLRCLSGTNRVGGVAHDCMKIASKYLFPWLQSPLCCDQVFFSHPEWVATQYQRKLSKRRNRNRHPDGSRGCDANKEQSVLVHLFNSGLYSIWWSFYNQFGFIISPLLSDYFPLGELIRTLASEK